MNRRGEHPDTLLEALAPSAVPEPEVAQVEGLLERLDDKFSVSTGGKKKKKKKKDGSDGKDDGREKAAATKPARQPRPASPEPQARLEGAPSPDGSANASATSVTPRESGRGERGNREANRDRKPTASRELRPEGATPREAKPPRPPREPRPEGAPREPRPEGRDRQPPRVAAPNEAANTAANPDDARGRRRRGGRGRGSQDRPGSAALPVTPAP